MSVHRLLSLSVDSLARLPMKIPDYVQQYKLEKGELPMKTLRTLRNLAILKDEPSLLEVVLHAGCDCEYYPEDINPLHDADDYNSGVMVEMLLKAGALITEPERVFRAAEDGSFKRLLAWLSFIPDPTITDKDGRFAWDVYHRSRVYGRLSLAEQQAQILQLEKVLLERSVPQAQNPSKSALRL